MAGDDTDDLDADDMAAAMADEMENEAAAANQQDDLGAGGDDVQSAADADDGDDFLKDWEGFNPALDEALDNATGRALNQDEIDNLLGFDEENVNKEGVTGIEAIIESGMVSYERLPMLEIVFDRLVRMLSTSLRNFTSDNVEISIDAVRSVRFGDYLNSIPLPAMMAVFKAEEWDNFGLITVDSSLIYSIVDVLLGGRRGTATMRIEGRPYTTIERNLVERMIAVILNDLSQAFEPLSSVAMRFDRLETNPRFATIARPANAAIVARLRIDMEDRGGRLDLLLPYATLEPVREVLLQMFMGEKFGRDSIWENHLATELWFTDIKLRAVLDETIIGLDTVLNWEVGSFLPLSNQAEHDIKVKCGDADLFKGKLGNRNGNIAVRIDSIIK
ncbi:MAG: flagellar motor switch protein FliM [Alphaproteobacteria bacterium]